MVVGKITSGAGKAPTVSILVLDVDVFKRIISKDWTGGLCVVRSIIYIFIYKVRECAHIMVRGSPRAR